MDDAIKLLTLLSSGMFESTLLDYDELLGEDGEPLYSDEELDRILDE